MAGAEAIVGTFLACLVLVFLARLLDRVRHTEPGDDFETLPDPLFSESTRDGARHAVRSSGRYDSMNDHGNRDADGGL